MRARFPPLGGACWAAGETTSIGPNDLRAFDLIGYEINVQEPGSLALLAIGGIAVVSGRSQDRKTRSAT